MPWVDELSETRELKRCIRDLVALTTLPAIWKDYSPQQLVESVAAALLSMLNADLVHVSVSDVFGEPAAKATRISAALGQASTSVVERIIDGAALARREQVVVIDCPIPPGTLRVAAVPIGLSREGFIVVGATRTKFPSETHRLLLGIAANDANIALQRWQATAEQQRLHTLMERSSEFVGFSSLDAKPLYLNSAGRKLLGLSDSIDAGHYDIFDFLAPHERDRARRELMPQVMKSGRWLGELNLRHLTTGEMIPALVDWFRIDDPRSGRPVNMATVSRDLRDRKMLEADLRQLNESLERRVVERTSELADALERLSLEAAERSRADRRAQELQLELFHASRLSAAGQMAGALAHELNQPLTAIANSVNAARRMLANGGHQRLDTVRDTLDEAVDQTLRAGEIIRRLRDFVRPGDMEMRIESLPVLISEASVLVSAGAGTGGLKVRLQFDSRAETVLGNRIQLQQVMLNLIRNAEEAMALGESHDVDVTSVRLNEDTIEVSVADCGVGVSEDVAEHLFEAFHTTKTSGMGLGLSICRGIVEAHGGKLRYRPNEGGGAVFSFTLPAVSTE